MNVTINQEGNKYNVILEGRVDTSNAAQFEQDLKPLMESSNAEIQIDCSGMTYTSSQGLRYFLMLQKHVMSHKGSLVLCNMQPQVKEVFDITGFSNIIKIV
ncbi:MAG: STAS domain-containing protein [Bacteroidales bacterium]|nr:STAS domain-containing protein [Bacteroidales bacterium]